MAITPATIPAANTYVSPSTPDTIVDDSMVLDGDFDFFSLEDPNIAVSDHIKETYAPKDSKTKTPEPEVEVEYEEDGEDEGDIDFDELDGDEDVEDGEESDEEEAADSVDDEAEGEDAEEEVDYEGYEVTLPSGETIKLSDAVRGYKDSVALQEEKAAFESAKEDFEKGSEELGKYLELAKLEALRVIEDYADFDWAGLAKQDPAAYVDNKEFLEKYQERYNEILQAQETVTAKQQAEQQAATEVKARECATVLQRDIAGWGPELYQQLMAYGVENGASVEEMQQCVDPAIFKMMHKAMQFDKGAQTVKAKIKTTLKQPTKVVKAQAKELAPDNKKAKLIKKASTHSLDARDVDDMFSMLED